MAGAALASVLLAMVIQKIRQLRIQQIDIKFTNRGAVRSLADSTLRPVLILYEKLRFSSAGHTN